MAFIPYCVRKQQRALTDMDGRTSRNLIVPILLGLIAIVCGWHYLCHLLLEDNLRENANASLREYIDDATVHVEIGPLSNVVDIGIEVGSERANGLWKMVKDALLEEIRQELEPEIERALHTRTRRDMDVYAMLLPYKVSIAFRDPKGPDRAVRAEAGASSVVNDVRKAQQALLECGYDVGQVDGVLGPQTQRAIRTFRVSHGFAERSISLQDFADIVREECSTPTPPPDIQLLIEQENLLNDRCRGGSGDQTETWAACENRDEIYKSLKAQGWCYGHEPQPMSDRRWEPCR